MNDQLKKAILVGLGLVFSGVFLALFLHRIRWDEVGAALRQVDIWPWLVLAVACDLSGFFVRGYRTRLLVRDKGRMSVLTATNVVVIGHASNNLLPGRLGEIARSGMLSERTGMPFSQSLTITVLERVLDGLAMICFLFVAIALLHVGPWRYDSLLVAAPPLLLSTLVVLVMILFPNRVTIHSSRILSPLPVRWHRRLMRIVVSVVNGVAPLRSPRLASGVTLLSLLTWLVEGATFWLVFHVLGIDLDFRAALLVMTISHLGTLLPSSPAYIGVFHWACQQSLVFLGISVNLAASYAIVVHLVFTVPCIVWGIGVIAGYSVELGNTIRLARRARSFEKELGELPVQGGVLGMVNHSHESKEPTRLLSSVIEAMLPASRLSTDQRASVHRDTSRFIVGQLGQLPRRHQILFRLGMFGFRAWILLTRLRDFPSLSHGQRETIVNRWMHSPLFLVRLLFRPMRSLAALAFYDNPAVMRTLQPSPVQEPETLAVDQEPRP